MRPAAKTTILLIRHGHTDAVGQRLVGRLPGVHLTDVGRAQARRVCARLRRQPVAAVYASPLERAIETAQPLAESRGLAVQTLHELIEIDFGAWTGCTFAELLQNPDWNRFNESRGSAPVPDGETARDAQARIVGALRRLHEKHAGETVAAVSHADVIRAAVLHVAGVPLDEYYRYQIEPASVTAVRWTTDGARLAYVNRTVADP